MENNRNTTNRININLDLNISFKDTLSEESNHQQIYLRIKRVEANFKMKMLALLVYSQNTNDSINLCTLEFQIKQQETI